MFKNTDSQKLTVMAFADAGHASLDAGEPVTSDAAQITLKIEQDDDGTQSASNDVNPTEVEDGQYRFDLTQAETNGDKLTFYPESSTAGVQVVAMPSNVIYTRPANAGDLAIDANGRVDVGSWLGTAVTTSSTSSKPEMDAYSISDDAAAANNLELACDGTGYNIGGGDVVSASVTGAVGSISGVTFPANFSALGIEADGDVTKVNLCDSNTDMRGTDSASTHSAADVWSVVARTLTANTNLNDPTAAAIADAVCDEILSGHTDAGSLGKAIADVLADTGELQTNQGNWVTATGFSTHDAAAVKTAMEANGSKLDHLWEMTEDDGGIRRLTTNALEQAPGASGAVDLVIAGTSITVS